MSSLNSLPLSEARFELGHSWIYVRVLVICSFWTIFSISLSDFTIYLKIILVMSIVFSFIYSSYYHIHQQKTYINFKNHSWMLETRSFNSSNTVSLEVLLDLGLFILIRCKDSTIKRYLIVFEDQWSNQQLRSFMALYHMLKKQSTDHED